MSCAVCESSLFFFFSSRRRHTRCSRDWSSDVCSSDLQYQRIAAHRSFFGKLDPFGDFDLILGAARLNLRILDLPIRYRERVYGDTNIRRWKHGLLLLRMTV